VAKYYEGIPLEGMIKRFVSNYLTKSGWLASADKKEPIDNIGPVPWFTYPAIRMLEQIITPELRVFEYGSGGSSIWWSERVSEVCSVEHDLEWYKEISDLIGSKNKIEYTPPNMEVDVAISPHLDRFFSAIDYENFQDINIDETFKNYCAQYNDYAAKLLNFPKGYFDIVVVDGRARVYSTWIAMQQLGPNGMIIFDNSDRESYLLAYQLLHEAGYARIDFWGCGPINPYEWCTSVFTKTLEPFYNNTIK